MKKFMTIWMGELISSIGSGMTAFAIGIYVYQMTKSVALVSVVTLLAYLPTILLSPVGGVLADRYDRRLLMILGDLLSGLGLLYIFICTQTGHIGILPICIGVTISSVFISLLEPAYKATISDLVPATDYAKASGMMQMAGASRYLISPAIAGIILAVSDIRTILVIDMLTIVVTVTATMSVRNKIEEVKPDTENFNFYREFNQGIQSIVKDRGVLALVVLMGLVCFFVAFIQTLMLPMILAFADTRSLGIMESISAVGMLAGSILIGMMNIQKNYTRILMAALACCGVFMAFTGMTTNVVWIVVTSFLFFAALPFVNTCADVLIRSVLPNEVQGRAWGMIGILTQSGYIAAYAVCGLLADRVFNPMLATEGILAGSIGRVIGTGEGRGIGLMLILAGLGMALMAIIFGKNQDIRNMERISDEKITAVE